MESICVRCSTVIAAEELYVVCQGFCIDAYHVNCAKLTTDDLERFKRNTCIWWMCIECGKMMRELRKDDSLKTKRATSVSNRTKPKPSAVQEKELVDEILELKNEITSIHRSIADLSSAYKAHNSLQENIPLAQSSPKSISTLSHGSRHSSYDSTATQGKFWLFFTKIKNTVTEEQMLKMVSESIGANDAVVKKLVSRWKNVSLMPFISFKIGINSSLKDIAMKSTSWPEGVCYREFHESFDLWEP